MRKSYVVEGSFLSKGRAFTLIELLVILSILLLLAALLLPVLTAARGVARKTSCVSNLRQVGLGISLYLQDSDGLYPAALNPSDAAHPEEWADSPQFQSLIPTLPQFHVVLQPYLRSGDIFLCPSDTGLDRNPYPGWGLAAEPSSFSRFGTSYFYRTSLAAEQVAINTLQHPAEAVVLSDADGKWHGSAPVPISNASLLRYNALFADNHVKNVSHPEMARLVSTDR